MASEWRHEKKFLINAMEYEILRGRLSEVLRLDKHARNGYANFGPGYHIRSLYFDDMYETGMEEKLSGVQKRRKFRIRIYNLSDSVITLEVKIKNGNFVRKESCPLSREETDLILAGDLSFIHEREEPVLQDLLAQNRACLLKPVVLVDYYREPFVHPLGNTRITFDRQLRSSGRSIDLFNARLPMIPIIDPALNILEIKFDHFLPEFIWKLVQEGVRQPLALSKYVMCRQMDSPIPDEDKMFL